MSPRSLVRGLALAALLWGAAIPPADAKPALWVVRGATATIYLFGTFHALRPGMEWRSPKLDHAFAESKELWLELADGGNYRASIPLVQRLASDFTHPLSNKLTPTQLARLDAALHKIGKQDGRAGMEWMRPWFVAMLIGAGPPGGVRLERGSGADLTLQEDAAEADKPVHALETKEQQLRIFADLLPDQELSLLDDALRHADDGPGKLDTLLNAWMAGDVETIGRVSADQDGPISGVVYRRLLVDRNKAWAGKITELLTGSGTLLIAGGAAHFAGPDSVLVQLAARGIKTQRLQ